MTVFHCPDLPVNLPPCQPGQWLVTLRQHIINLPIGLLPQEQGTPQPLGINAQVWLRLPPTLNDDIEATFNYATLLEALDQLVAESTDASQNQIQLLETVVERLLAVCKTAPCVEAAYIEVHKLALLPANATVGLSHHWQK